MDMKLDFALLHATLYHSSPVVRVLTENEYNEAFQLCNGYGRMSMGQLQSLGLLGDWSHVRDADDDAIVAAASKVREFMEAKGSEDRLAVAAQVEAYYATYPISWVKVEDIKGSLQG